MSAAQDSDLTDDSATIAHTVSGGDYASVTADSVAVTVTDNTPPAQVTGVTVTPAAESLKVDWTAVTGATGYKVQWKSGMRGIQHDDSASTRFRAVRR